MTSMSIPTSPAPSGNWMMISSISEARKLLETLQPVSLSTDDLFFLVATLRPLSAQAAATLRKAEAEELRRYRAQRELEKSGQLPL